MKRRINVDFKNLPYAKLIIASTIINIVFIFVIIIFRNNLPPQIPLFYGKPQSGEQLGSNILLIILPLAALAVTFINSLVIKFTKDEFSKKILVTTIGVTTLLSVITIIKTYILIGSF